MFKYCNPHPENKRVNDCVKRAIVIATGIDYYSVQTMLNRAKKEFGEKRYWESFIEKCLFGLKNNKDMRYIDCGHRFIVKDFAICHPTSTHILRCSKHLVCSKNGNYYDTWDSGYKSVYIDWLIPNKSAIIDNIKNNYPKICKNILL